VLVFLVALYLFGDWVLLILALLLILGLIWTSKQAIPRFWTPTVLMLDMGPVREGERVHYRGLPWRPSASTSATSRAGSSPSAS